MSKATTTVAGFKTQISKERTAIEKRMRVVLHMVEKNRAFWEFESELEFAQEMGAFDDCPVGNVPGSMFSKSASYDSQTVHREMLQALSDAVQDFWKCKRLQSPRFSVFCDETTDVAGMSQLGIGVKIVLETGKVALPLIGLHNVKRATAQHLFNALLYQLVERDGYTDDQLQLLFNDFCADTCVAGPGDTVASVRALQLHQCVCASHMLRFLVWVVTIVDSWVVDSFSCVHAASFVALSHQGAT